MKTRLLIICLLLTASGLTHAIATDGTVAFDCPDAPYAKFQFHFTGELITLADTTAAFGTVSDIYIGTYHAEAGTFDKFVAYYGETLKAASWQTLHENNDCRLHTLEVPSPQSSESNESISGIFVIAQSDNDVHLLNIVGDIPSQQIGQLLANIGQLGIEITALKSLDAEISQRFKPPPEPMPLPTLFRTASEQPDFFRVGFSTEKGLTFSRSHEVTLHGQWRYYGHSIEEIHIRSDNSVSIDQISQALQNGDADIAAVLKNLPAANISERKSKLNVGAWEQSATKHKSKLIVRAWERSATISVGDIPQHEDEPVMLSKQFRTREGEPIHEIQIQGHVDIQPDDVRKALEKGPEEIDEALAKLPNKITDYLETAELRIEEEGARRTAIISLVEKPLSERFYFDSTPQVGFNRVTGWELGARIDSGFRRPKNFERSYHISVPSEFRGDNLSKFFGRIGYGFGNKQIYYTVGGKAAWGEPNAWHLGLTTQLHRTTSIIAPDLFPVYDDTGMTILRVFGVPDHQNYYLREGVEVALQWRPMTDRHSFKLALFAESHDSLRKNTDWHVFNWRSKSEVRENPVITPGRMRSVLFRYDYSTRDNYLGWHNTFFVEHSNPTFGSDFEWTRFQTHLRYAYPIREHQIRVRAVGSSATAPLPLQRQFVIGGIGTLNGYPLYAFQGDAGFLLNTEFLYNVAKLGTHNLSVALILDGGHVWDVSESEPRFDPKGSLGLGLQLGNDVDVLRFVVAKAFDAEQDVRFNFMFFYSF